MEKALRRLIKPKSPHTRNPFPSESIGVRYRSEVLDVIHYGDGRVETIDHGHNVMLDEFLPLLTDLLVNGGDRQLKYWAVGKGETDWDIEPTPEKVVVSITSPCTQTGNVTVTLNGTARNVQITMGDSAVTVANKIKAQATATGVEWEGWDVEQNGSVVVFTAQSTGDMAVNGKNVHTYNPNATGALGNVTITDGTFESKRPVPTHDQSFRSEGKGCLHNEIYRKAITTSKYYENDGIHFLDSEGNKSATPTPIIEIQLTFEADEGLENGNETPWREFSIVGGSGATATFGTGYYMNVKNHACIVKTNDMIVERKIRFTFTNSDTTD